MIDPKTLRAGDKVIFGGKIEKTVSAATPEKWRTMFSDGTWMDNDVDFWQIAEIKKPDLPEKVGEFYLGTWKLRDHKSFAGEARLYFPNWPKGVGLYPSELLKEARKIIKQLEDAGVRDE